MKKSLLLISSPLLIIFCNTLIAALLLIIAACSTSHKGIELKSPGGQLKVALSVDDSLQFVLQYKGSEVITLERMGFQFEEYPDFGRNLEAEVSDRGSVNQHWEPIGAKNSPVVDHYNYMTVTLTEIHSPFRVIMVAERPGALIESNIIMNLADPNELEDTSWIKPGICVWDSWWSRGVQMDTETIKKFIDFASYMGYPYQQIDWTWYGETFKVGDPYYIPNEDVDITTWIPEIDLPHILEYAKDKNVGIWLWLLSHHADAQIEEAFALYQQWGVVGVKIDFMERDDQEMVLWYENTLRLAAKHNLMVNFHGNYKPTGVERTFPNLMTREGVLGNEYNIWSDEVTPEHNVTIPFTRMVAGQMDYTIETAPGGGYVAIID